MPAEGLSARPDTSIETTATERSRDISREAGIAQLASSGMGMVCADYDRDGDTDIFVLNDVAGNFLLRNDGSGKFEEVGRRSGVRLQLNGHELGSMGVDCGDYDNDGWLDFFMTSYAGECRCSIRNLGDGCSRTRRSSRRRRRFAAARQLGNAASSISTTTATATCSSPKGICRTTSISIPTRTPTRRATLLLMNRGPGSFTDVSKQAGDGLLPKQQQPGRGLR